MESATPTATPSAISRGSESRRPSPDLLTETLTVAIDEGINGFHFLRGAINGFNRVNNECLDKLHAVAAACTGPNAAACASARAALLECVYEEPARDTQVQQPAGNSS